METFNLNLIPGKNNPVVHASQFDEGRVIRVNLFEGSSVYTLDGTEVISISVRKNDGHIVTEAITNTSDSYVEIVTTEQMTACAGSNLCELKIEKGSDVIGTLNFILEVEVDPLDGGDPSESFIHDLNAQIYAAVADQYDSNNVIFDAAPTPGHGVGYVVTSEGTPDELEDMTDVTYTGSPTSGEALVWDGSKWTNGMPSVDLDDLGDVEITTPTAGEILEYNGVEWVNAPNPASTTNFGAPYDENTTYNVPSLVIYNNLLYTLNDGEDGTTGPWDPTKWTQTSVAELAQSIGTLSSLTTTNQDSLVDAVNEVNGKVNCALITQNRLTSDYTLTSNTATRVFDDGTANLSAGNYIFEVTFPAIWSSASGVIHGGVRIDGTYSEASMIYGPQEVCGLITFKGTVNIASAGNHSVGSAIRTEAGKTVTIKSYVSATVTLWRV